MEKWTNRDNKYYAKDDVVVLSDWARYDYAADGWVYDQDSFFHNVINDSKADPVTEAEARKIVEKNGGTNFDKQEYLIMR